MKTNRMVISRIEAFLVTFHPLLIAIAGIILFRNFVNKAKTLDITILACLSLLLLLSIILFLLFQKRMKIANRLVFVLWYLVPGICITSLIFLFIRYNQSLVNRLVNGIIIFANDSLKPFMKSKMNDNKDIEITLVVITIFWLNLSIQTLFILKKWKDWLGCFLSATLITFVYFIFQVLARIFLPGNLLKFYKNPLIFYTTLIPLILLLFLFLIGKEKRIVIKEKLMAIKKWLHGTIGKKRTRVQVKKVPRKSLLKSICNKKRNGIKKKYDVFLAHNSRDKHHVRKIAKVLRKRGIKPWLDEEQIPPGGEIQSILQQTITKINTAAVIIGMSGMGKWQSFELAVFINQCVKKNIPIIPVLLPGVNSIPDSLPFLQLMHWVKFNATVLEPDGLRNLEWGIKGKK